MQRRFRPQWPQPEKYSASWGYDSGSFGNAALPSCEMFIYPLHANHSMLTRTHVHMAKV